MRSSEIRPGIRRFFRLAARDATRHAAADMDDEIRLHLALRIEQLVQEGLTPDAARAEAERRFGPLDEAREALHDSAARRDRRRRASERFDIVRHDLWLALRGLRRSPAFLVTAVTCIALGVGANAAAFSLFDELLLRPLPVREPERLVNLAVGGPETGITQCDQAGACDEVFSAPMFRDLARAQTVFTGIAAHKLFIANVAYDGQATQGDGVSVSGSYFPVLGVRPALGRLLTPADDEPGQLVAVVSHAFWTTRLGADSAAIGRTLLVNDRALTIVGVAPRGFEGTTLGVRPAVYVPLASMPDVNPFFGPRSELDNRQRQWLHLFARLRPGVDVARARAAMTAVYRPILADVEAPLQQGMSAATLARFRARELAMDDGRHGQSRLRGATRAPMQLLLGITAIVVLIASANIANLLLARGATRTTEMAVRLSLGAGRRQLVTQLLTESCVLALLGGAASLAVAHGILGLIGSFLPASSLGTGATLSLTLRPSVLAFAAGVSLGTGLVFGLFPALHATRPDLVASIRAGAGQIAGGHRSAARFRSSLVTAQIALSMALLVSAGLFIKSLRNLGRVDLGLDVDHVVTFGLLPGLSGYAPQRAAALLARAESEVQALPGVTAVGAASVPLFFGLSNGDNVRVQGFRRDPDTDANTRVNEVGAGYFRALGMRLVAGRAFTAADRLGSPKVAVVNEAFAHKFGLGRDAVGKRMAVDGDGPGDVLDIEIVGLVRDATYDDVKRGAPPTLFTPYRQDSLTSALAFYVRTSIAPERTLRSIPGVVARLDRNLPVVMLKTLPQQVRENVYLDRLIGTLSAGFAALATLLAAVGLYGVLAYTVAQRTREIGVRMALGADAGRVRRIVLGQVGRMVLIGAPLGLVAALGIGGAARSLLFGLTGHDPVVAAAAAVVLTVVALGAAYVPAWRASRVSPVGALRS